MILFSLLKLMASTGLRVSDIVRLQRAQILDSDGQVVRALRIKMAETERWIDRSLREDARETVRDYLATRNDSYP